MLKRIKALFLGNLFICAIGITISIICLSLFRIPSTGIKITNIDKAFHSVAYFTLAISWLFTFYKKPKLKYLIVFSCIIFGIIIELLQSNLTVYRTGEIHDVIANTLGVLLALIIFNVFLKKKWIN